MTLVDNDKADASDLKRLHKLEQAKLHIRESRKTEIAAMVSKLTAIGDVTLSELFPNTSVKELLEMVDQNELSKAFSEMGFGKVAARGKAASGVAVKLRSTSTQPVEGNWKRRPSRRRLSCWPSPAQRGSASYPKHASARLSGDGRSRADPGQSGRRRWAAWRQQNR